MFIVIRHLTSNFPSPLHPYITNQPIHFHHSGNVDGSVIRKNVVRDSDQRCIVVHGTSHVLVENNVAYDHRGHCFIASEDGYETDNNFKDNLGARTKKGANLPGTSDDRR